MSHLKERLLYGLGHEQKIKAGKAVGAALALATHHPDGLLVRYVMDSSLIEVGWGIGRILAESKGHYPESEYPVGKNGELNFFHFFGGEKKLSDGTVIHPGDLIGSITLIKNVELLSEERQFRFARSFIRNFAEGMVSLADRIERHDFPIEVKAITGLSHLAEKRVSEKLGFDVEEVPSVVERLFATIVGVTYSATASDSNTSFSKIFVRKWKRINRVWMSTAQIVRSKPLFQNLCDKIPL